MNNDFVDINLLPRPVRPLLAGREWRRVMLPGLALLTIALAVLLGSWLIAARNQRALAAQQAQVEELRRQVVLFTDLMAEVEGLQQQVATLATQAEQLEADAESVRAQNPPFAPFLIALTAPLLPRMELTGMVAGDGNRFLVQGEAGSSALVIEYAALLEQRPEVRKVTPQSIERLGGSAPPGTVRWTLEVQR